ncbi:immunoglobulin domain-containing protein [Microbacterium sp. PM5]|uniref:immunoglobulin domain-containing protein n=1 Tax=Microbacterium sp. PM5 TaxID=2014534 RepID=UPI000DD0FC3E|nr:immunoglobulin domain-containing protein [Microbacterium sp. PM5]AXA95080.1 hypothetical protein CEP17_00850 [Microbacterium sp. PM5]
MKKTIQRGVALFVTAAAVTAVGALAAAPAYAAAPVSNQTVYLLDGNALPLPATGSNWKSTDVLLSPVASDPSAASKFSDPSSFVGVITFIANPGTEDNPAGYLGTGGGGGWGPYVTPDTLTDNPAVAGDFHDLLNAGGTFSLGQAWLDGSNHAVQVVFTTVVLGAGTATTGGSLSWTAPVSTTAPAITTQPADKTVLPGQSAVFTAAASGSPAPTVKWQSSTDGTTWSDVAGATSDTLTVSNVQLAQSGTKYQAVYTNSAGTATTSAATLTVTNVVPTEPTGSDAGKVTIADPADGATTVTVPAGVGLKAQTLTAWGWSTATNLGQVTADATSGDVVVNIATLAPGAHTIALTQPGSSTVVVWGTFTVPVPSYPAKTDTVDLQAAVTASDLWSLNAAQTAIDFGNVARNASSTKSLGKVTVIDDRKVLKGWTLDAAWSKFTAGSDEIPASALTITPKAFDNGSLLPGVTLGTNGTKIAESTAVSTLTDGALLDADLKFVAPKDAAAGQYHSTLTLTLTSK